MTQITEAIALGIGAQTVQGTPLPAVLNAVDLVNAPATGTSATGILLRNPADVAQSFTRIESDGGTVLGGFTRQAGGFQRTEAAFSFDIDWKGNGATLGAPAAPNDFDALEYLLQILDGHRLVKGTPTSSQTPYDFGIPAFPFKTLKLWRGKGDAGSDESWTIQDCQFNLSWTWTAGEKSVLTVEVIPGVVTYNAADTFPTSTDFGTQADAAPILQSANAQLNSIVQGFRTATLSSAYPVVDKLDTNISGGIVKQLSTPRNVQFSAEWYGDDARNDFTDLESDTEIPLDFRIGTVAVGSPDVVNAWKMSIPLFRSTLNEKVDPDTNDVVRTIDGYASDTVLDNELLLEAV